jgi:hypothetical protein
MKLVLTHRILSHGFGIQIILLCNHEKLRQVSVLLLHVHLLVCHHGKCLAIDDICTAFHVDEGIM